MTPVITLQSLAERPVFQGRPCLSPCQPTHRHDPANLQDPIHFRHLLQALEASLRQQHHLFRQASYNPVLMAEGLMVDPEALEAGPHPRPSRAGRHLRPRKTWRRPPPPDPDRRSP